MNKRFKGNNYDYIVDLSDADYFEIVAIRKKDKQKSAVTNLNCIIGEIIEPILKTNNVADSSIKVNQSLGIQLFNLTEKVLSDKSWVAYLEKNLDEDFEISDQYRHW
jgi:hypothetical protein